MPRPYNLTEKQIVAIQRLALMGASRTVIAEAVGVAQTTISYHCADEVRTRRGLAPLAEVGLPPADRRSDFKAAAPAPKAEQPRRTVTTKNGTHVDITTPPPVAPAPKRGYFARLFGG